jgi:hypothetical protein
MPPGRGRGRGRGGGGRGGRPVGAKNYKNGLLVDIIDELRPFGNNMMIYLSLAGIMRMRMMG